MIPFLSQVASGKHQRSKAILLLFACIFLASAYVKAQQAESPQQIQTLMDGYRYEEAQAMCDRLLLLDSSNPDLYILKARALAAFSKYADALAVARKGYLRDSTNLKVISSLIEFLNQAGETKKACVYARKRVALSPENRYFRLQLANLCYQAENFREGLQIQLDIYPVDSTNITLMKQIVNAYMELGKLDSAVVFCNKILKIIPFDPFVTNKLANLYIKINAYKKGIELTTAFLLKDSINTAILKSNGYLHYLSKDYPSAVLRFESALRHGDSSRFTYKYLGMANYKQEVYVWPYFQSAYWMDTTENEMCFYYGVAAAKSYLYDTAVFYLNKTLSRLKASEQFGSLVYLELASLYNDHNKSDTALILLERAYERNRTNNDILFRMAYQYDIHLQNYKEALFYYRDFISHSPEAKLKKSAKVNKEGEVNITLYEHAIVRVSELEILLKEAPKKTQKD